MKLSRVKRAHLNGDIYVVVYHSRLVFFVLTKETLKALETKSDIETKIQN